MLHKINLIESFKEYLIGLKVSRYKVNLDPTYFLDLCFHLTVLLFVLGFHSFAFAHRLAHTVTTLIHTHSSHTPFTFIPVRRLPHLHGRLNMKILLCFIGVFEIIVTKVCNV